MKRILLTLAFLCGAGPTAPAGRRLPDAPDYQTQ